MIHVSVADIIYLVIGALLAATGEMLRRRGRRELANGAQTKLAQMLPKLGLALSIVGAWLFISQLLPIFFGPRESEKFNVEISPPATNVFGLMISNTILVTWAVMLVVLCVALAIRLKVIPHMKQVPTGIQNVLEIMVEQIDKYASAQAHGLGQNLSAYLFAIAVLLVGCASVELMGVRAPTSDITFTFALALITFVLINYYGVKRKGPIGRVKALNAQGPIVMVLRVISDCAIPVSMACRLFGNMLGGMIVMDLLYSALGSGAVGIPSVLGLYFNVFHPLIQAFIFITLTLTFINEAIE